MSVAHGLTGGIISDLQGGKFGHGFISAGITKGAQVLGVVSDKLIQGAIGSAIIGGTVSKITGGKFANGAITAAFQFAMNKFVTDGLRPDGKVLRKRVDVQDPVEQEPEVTSVKRERVYTRTLGDPPPNMKYAPEAAWRAVDASVYSEFEVEYVTTSTETTQDTVTTQWLEDSQGNVSNVGQRVETKILSTDINTTVNIRSLGIVGALRLPDNANIVLKQCIDFKMQGC